MLGRSGEEVGFWPRDLDRRGVVKRLKASGHLRHVEGSLPTRDGTGHEVLASFELLYDRERHYMLTVLHDVAEERMAERELRRNAAYLDEAEVAILAVDEDDRVDYWNPAAARLLGLAGTDLRRTLSDLTAGFEPQLWIRNIGLRYEPDEISGEWARSGSLVVAVLASRLDEESR